MVVLRIGGRVRIEVGKGDRRRGGGGGMGEEEGKGCV